MIVINVEIWFFMLFFTALVAHCSSRIKPIVYDGDKNSVTILVEIYQHLNDSDKRHSQKKKKNEVTALNHIPQISWISSIAPWY